MIPLVGVNSLEALTRIAWINSDYRRVAIFVAGKHGISVTLGSNGEILQRDNKEISWQECVRFLQNIPSQESLVKQINLEVKKRDWAFIDLDQYLEEPDDVEDIRHWVITLFHENWDNNMEALARTIGPFSSPRLAALFVEEHALDVTYFVQLCPVDHPNAYANSAKEERLLRPSIL